MIQCVNELDEYFSKKRTTFTFMLKMHGTSFQQKVWNKLLKILYGKTISYKTLAERLGSPALTRTVGSANGKNPLAIVVPCHRVIGNDGSLTGYAGGIQIKKRLLELEKNCETGNLFFDGF